MICTDVAHMHVDECGAPERLAGTKLLTVETEHGKLGPDDVRRWQANRGDEHRVQPRLVSITQATELGSVYTLEETRAIADAAHELGMLLHVDGARLANAAAALDASLAAHYRGRRRRGFLRRDQERLGGRRRRRVLPPRARRRLRQAQADAPAGVEDALHLGPVPGAPRRRAVARERAPRERDGRFALAAAVRAIDGVEISFTRSR